MNPQAPADSTYRLSTAHTIRIVAPFEVLVGLAWVGLALLGLPRGWTLALVAATVAIALVGGCLLIRPPAVLTLTSTGFKIGFARNPGRAGAPWREVESVGTAGDVGGIAALVFVLVDGERAALPLSLLGPRAVEAQHEVHERLNTAYGYRRF